MRIIIHFGTFKTGSSSIQQSLFQSAKRLSTIYYPCFTTPAHNYVPKAFNLKSNNASRVENETLDLNRFTPIQQQTLSKLENSFKLNEGRDILLSSESISSFRRRELRRLHTWLKTYTNDIIAVGYIRPPIAYINSAFQQTVKGGKLKSLKLEKRVPQYKDTFRKFEFIFGKENVHFWKFDPKTFPDQCVVRDFCQRLNIDLPADAVVRINEGLSVDALSLLYAYSKYSFGSRVNAGELNLKEYNLLLDLMTQLQGNKIQFSSQIIKPLLKDCHDDIKWMESRLGTSLAEPEVQDDENSIRSEADLLRFSPQALQWLATQLGKKYCSFCHPQMTGEEVAQWMHQLRLGICTK